MDSGAHALTVLLCRRSGTSLQEKRYFSTGEAVLLYRRNGTSLQEKRYFSTGEAVLL